MISNDFEKYAKMLKNTGKCGGMPTKVDLSSKMLKNVICSKKIKKRRPKQINLKYSAIALSRFSRSLRLKTFVYLYYCTFYHISQPCI